MARPRKYWVKPDELLAAIDRAWREGIEELTTEINRFPPGALPSSGIGRIRVDLDYMREFGPTIDFERIAGHSLSRGEQFRYVEAMHALEQARLIRVYGDKATRFRVTPAGMKHLQAAGLLPTGAQPAEPAGDD